MTAFGFALVGVYLFTGGRGKPLPYASFYHMFEEERRTGEITFPEE